MNGAQVARVDEPLLPSPQALIETEFDEVVEPKTLLPSDLLRIVGFYGSYIKAAAAIGASEAFVRQNCLKRVPPDFSKNQGVFGIRKPVRTYSF